MIEKVSIICDLSGSMAEGGKRFIVRYIVRTIEQYFRLGHMNSIPIKLIAWSDSAQVIDWTPLKEDVPSRLLECKGSAEAEPLIELLGYPKGELLILLTDGYWSMKTENSIIQWNEKLGSESLLIVKAGSDTNSLKLKDVYIFSSDELFKALDYRSGNGQSGNLA